MESFLELERRRQSCRRYDPRAVEPEKLEALAEAVRLSPSACNSQPWRVIFVTGASAAPVRAAVQPGGSNPFAEGCPAFAVLVEEPAVLKPAVAEKFGSQAFAQIDLGIATAHYCLAATDLGLSTCVLGMIDEAVLQTALGVPQTHRIRLVIATGYAERGAAIREKTRKPLSEIAEFRS
ncbi:MAG TPA: nitroreductase family protein [Candidatus Fimenecus excrementigallinarum]|uniref:Nitroreductase family protein n=1 Tax=Candidatus Fimenecus excrementigallinarum TaxID=2840816 RepID=A0A9D1LDH9_9FIRM|nr:nitroreductase family protein [Candidatus Fimenecus excrementigallinarum]